MKIKIGWSQLYKPTPAKVIQISKAIKRLMITLGGIAFFASPKWVIVFAVIMWLADEAQEWVGTPDGQADGVKGDPNVKTDG